MDHIKTMKLQQKEQGKTPKRAKFHAKISTTAGTSTASESDPSSDKDSSEPESYSPTKSMELPYPGVSYCNQ